MKKYNKIFVLMIVAILTITLTGCNIFGEKKNTDSQLAKIKDTMITDLDNFSYSATITTETSLGSVPTTLECKQDNVNEITYCKTSTIGVTIEEYSDVKNKKIYTKTSAIYGGGDNNNKWIASNFSKDINSSNTWLSLNDYIFDLNLKENSEGKYYTGTISSKKLAEAIANTDSTIDIKNIINKDIQITVFINSSNYIESMSFEMEIIGIKEIVTINYKDFNTTGSIVIPNEVFAR